VLGDVFEMGSFAEAALKRVGEEIEGIDALVTVGEVSRYIAMGAELTGISNIVSFDTVESAIEYLKDFIKADDGVLIKASRGMHFERIYEAIKTEFGDDEIVTSN